MKTTVVTHIFNESYLLPMWLRHHRELFDDGIILDYTSTDDCRDIATELTPHWKFIDTGLTSFDAISLDRLINDVELTIVGMRLVLTVTEFLLGNPKAALQRHFIPQVMLVNMNDDRVFDEMRPFHHQVTWGLGSDTECIAPWWSRSMHPHPTVYGADGSITGRHYQQIDNGQYLIYRVSNCFVTEEMFERRLQIQHRIPDADKTRQMGVQHHNWNQGLTKEVLLSEQQNWRSQARDLTEILNKYDHVVK